MASQAEPHESIFQEQRELKQEERMDLEIQIKLFQKEEDQLEQMMLPCFRDAVRLKSKARRLEENSTQMKNAAAERKMEFRDLVTRVRQKRKLAKLLKKRVKVLKSEALDLEESTELKPEQEASQEKEEESQGGRKAAQDLPE